MTQGHQGYNSNYSGIPQGVFTGGLDESPIEGVPS
jgi:hypothetical protein